MDLLLAVVGIIHFGIAFGVAYSENHGLEEDYDFFMQVFTGTYAAWNILFCWFYFMMLDTYIESFWLKVSFACIPFALWIIYAIISGGRHIHKCGVAHKGNMAELFVLNDINEVAWLIAEKIDVIFICSRGPGHRMCSEFGGRIMGDGEIILEDPDGKGHGSVQVSDTSWKEPPYRNHDHWRVGVGEHVKNADFNVKAVFKHKGKEVPKIDKRWKKSDIKIEISGSDLYPMVYELDRPISAMDVRW